MKLIVHTARLPHHGCRGYTGRDALNITRGSGGSAGDPFAPSLKLLNEAQRLKRAAKRNEAALRAAWEWYAPRYMEEMRGSWRQHPAAWRTLLARGEVTLCCYCGTAERCHRRLLAQILVTIGKRLGIEVIDGGEREAAARAA